MSTVNPSIGSSRGVELVVAHIAPRSAADFGRHGRCDAFRGHRVLNWVGLFAEWRSIYADVLADDDGPV